MNRFLDALAQQRWDDHRYYHQSRINQTLHLISAIGFLAAYAVLPFDPPSAALIGWLVSMVTRQSGHFFFEPLGYDHLNQASNEHKEAIKVGYNLRRKVALLAIWIALPLLLLVDPGFFGLLDAASGPVAFVHNTGWLWLWLGVGGLVLRSLQLVLTKGLLTGIVWTTKILTDPFHDIALYHRAPLALLRGERLDPMRHAPQPPRG